MDCYLAYFSLGLVFVGFFFLHKSYEMGGWEKVSRRRKILESLAVTVHGKADKVIWGFAGAELGEQCRDRGQGGRHCCGVLPVEGVQSCKLWELSEDWALHGRALEWQMGSL